MGASGKQSTCSHTVGPLHRPSGPETVVPVEKGGRESRTSFRLVTSVVGYHLAPSFTALPCNPPFYVLSSPGSSLFVHLNKVHLCV